MKSTAACFRRCRRRSRGQPRRRSPPRSREDPQPVGYVDVVGDDHQFRWSRSASPTASVVVPILMKSEELSGMSAAAARPIALLFRCGDLAAGFVSDVFLAARKNGAAVNAVQTLASQRSFRSLRIVCGVTEKAGRDPRPGTRAFRFRQFQNLRLSSGQIHPPLAFRFSL